MQRRVTVFTRAAGWLGLPRLFSTMHDHGFAVDLMCVKGAFALNSGHVDRVLALGTEAPDQAWIDGLLGCESEHLLLGDDDAVDWLIRTSIGGSQLETFLKARGYDIATMAQARNKYALTKLALELGIPVPSVKLLGADVTNEALVAELGSPLVIKSAFGFAGIEVFICSDANEIRQARDMLPKTQGGFAQRFVPGVALMVPAACRNGKVLSKFAAVKRSTWPPVTGPSTIVEIADHPLAGEYVDTLVAALGLTGFISVDFVIDAQQQYWLMECNLRPVPVSHYKGVLMDAWLNNRAVTLPEASNGTPSNQTLGEIMAVIRPPSNGEMGIRLNRFNMRPEYASASSISLLNSRANMKHSIAAALPTTGPAKPT
jgi:hypothetical protein